MMMTIEWICSPTGDPLMANARYQSSSSYDDTFKPLLRVTSPPPPRPPRVTSLPYASPPTITRSLATSISSISSRLRGTGNDNQPQHAHAGYGSLSSHSSLPIAAAHPSSVRYHPIDIGTGSVGSDKSSASSSAASSRNNTPQASTLPESSRFPRRSPSSTSPEPNNNDYKAL
jgi:hypothetical protein